MNDLKAVYDKNHSLDGDSDVYRCVIPCIERLRGRPLRHKKTCMQLEDGNTANSYSIMEDGSFEL